MHVLVKKQTKKIWWAIFLIYNMCSNTIMKININGLKIKYVISTILKIFKLNFKYEFLKILNHKTPNCYFFF